MNLIVDVMEGDEFTELDGSVYHYRGEQWRRVALKTVGVWKSEGKISKEKPIDLHTFTRYCEGCCLTVVHFKSEPKVEEIGPPEWAIRLSDGTFQLAESEQAARNFAFIYDINPDNVKRINRSKK